MEIFKRIIDKFLRFCSTLLLIQKCHTNAILSCWLSPQILKNADACRLLERFADSCCPEVQLYIVQRWMQNANRLILSRANENFVRSGGLGQVLKDLKRAEKVISHVYGLDVKDE
jgi:hypothetical protein